MKRLILLFLISLSFANETLIKNLIGEYKFQTFKALLAPIINNDNIEENVKYLISNGLLDLNANKNEITPTFIFKTQAPLFDTKILYKTLKTIGYYSFYPTHIEKNNNLYKITLNIKTSEYINPINFIQTISQNGCQVVNIKKDENFTYFLNCEDRILNTILLSDEFKKEINAKGVYFISPNGFSKIEIKTSKFDNWYPYVVFYDKNLHIINIIDMDVSTNDLLLDIPEDCEYIKIADNFTKENFKRGIWIKGLQ
jgi:hypothetical protein